LKPASGRCGFFIAEALKTHSPEELAV